MDGILVINKPKGYTSHDVVNIVRKSLETPRVGHTGTLDPNATGVLPILVGRATKISKYLIEHKKTYVAELQLGKKSSTGDIEGKIIEEKPVPNLQVEEVEKILESFLGKQLQTPPIYSSIKINGKKAYEYARENKPIQMTPREIEVLDIKLITIKENVIIFKTQVSKGTYIRTLCEDIAQKLGTVGIMSNLCRTEVDNFTIEQSYELEKIKNAKLISIEEIFMKIPKIELNDRKKKLFLDGVKLSQEDNDGLYRVYNRDIFLGLGIVSNKLLKRDIIVIDNY